MSSLENWQNWGLHARQQGIPIRGRYAHLQLAFYAWANMNSMTWQYGVESRRGYNDSILSIICRDNRVTDLVPELKEYLKKGASGAQTFRQNIPPALRGFVPPALRAKRQEDPFYVPPILAAAIEAKRRAVPLGPEHFTDLSSVVSADAMSVDTNNTANTISRMMSDCAIGGSDASARMALPDIPEAAPSCGPADAVTMPSPTLQFREETSAIGLDTSCTPLPRFQEPSFVLSNPHSAPTRYVSTPPSVRPTPCDLPSQEFKRRKHSPPSVPDFYNENVSEHIVQQHEATPFDTLRNNMTALTASNLYELLAASDSGRTSVAQGLSLVKSDKEQMSRFFTLVAKGPECDSAKMMGREGATAGKKAMPALLKQVGAYKKQCELAMIVLERRTAKITEQRAADERMVEDMIRNLKQQAECREAERTRQQNTIQKNITHVKQQTLVAEEVESEVKAAETRFDLLERAANCGSRSANCTTWRGIWIDAIKHFDIDHEFKNAISAGIVAEQNAQMATNAQDNFIGAVVDGKVLNDDAMDGDTALADAAAMADDIAKDSNLKPAADPVANDKVAPKVQLLATNDQSNGEGFAVGLNNLKSSPEMNPSKKHVPAVSLESSSQSFNSFVLDDLSLKPNEDATSTNPSS
mmetsp:Transcript_20253/g.48693  ORF Transcript_20253/g.48693 Transcript_20253/m.48693 type:complete len:640 (-) Transcript_20253:338-2257(-)